MAWQTVGSQPHYDRARWYSVDGEKYPSVTTILSVINKPALVHWATNMERRAFEAALLDVLSQNGARDPEWVLGELAKCISGKKAFLRKQDEAAVIGTAAHAWIEWRTRQLLGEKVGPEPHVPGPALIAVEAWKDWAKAVDFRPLAVERVVYCEGCRYAGTLDWLAIVSGVPTLGDIKTSKAIYPEAFLQNVAYRHAARKRGLDSAQGLIVRLPKTLDDVTTGPPFEAMVVPEIPLEDFLAVFRVWRWQRRMAGQPTGEAVGA